MSQKNSTTRKSIIFHIPWSIDKNRPSASQLRPVKMLKAFQSLDYEVDVVMGSVEIRKKQIKTIKNKIMQGKVYTLLYSESSTYPTLIADGTKQALTHPLLDYKFLSYCKKKGIPIGLFYRDIYWKFPDFAKDIFVLKRWALKFLYMFDIYFYNKYLDIIYLPSLKMFEYINIKSNIKELPAGCEIYPNNQKKIVKTLNIIYVGGIDYHYRIEKLLKVVSKNSKIKLTICCRRNEWVKNINKYSQYLTPNIQIVHESGKQLHKLYEEADVASLFFEPGEYMNFAMPMKLFEYIGHCKPVIATAETSVGDFVHNNGIGWVIKYDEVELDGLLNSLMSNNKLLDSKIEQIKKISLLNTWKMRAYQVIRDLTIS